MALTKAVTAGVGLQPSWAAASVEKPQVLLIQCPDRPGLVFEVTGALFRRGVNITGNQEYVDLPTRTFYMRTEFQGEIVVPELLSFLRRKLPEGARVFHSRLEPKRMVVLATKEHHCVADILIRQSFGELNATVLGVIANQLHLRSLVERFDLPFYHLPCTGTNPDPQEREVLKLVSSLNPDYLVLAKYMRILSSGFCHRYPSQIINIHHSFLPAFAGARPYQQAFDRGVKVIGATAHFVTSELDSGPIIAQEVVPVDHTHSAEDLRRCGRDVEQLTLARALKLVFEDRVLLCGNRTVIFD
jgi:formyltetrahydrofolate deformylase